MVLKSIFEEQILHHAASLEQYSDSPYGDAGDYLQRYLGEDYKAGFLQLIADARRATRIPVIASINCVAAGEEWIEYAAAMARAGASALELNIFIQPVDAARSSQESSAKKSTFRPFSLLFLSRSPAHSAAPSAISRAT